MHERSKSTNSILSYCLKNYTSTQTLCHLLLIIAINIIIEVPIQKYIYIYNYRSLAKVPLPLTNKTVLRLSYIINFESNKYTITKNSVKIHF